MQIGAIDPFGYRSWRALIPWLSEAALREQSIAANLAPKSFTNI
jgi:hypothetical protein